VGEVEIITPGRLLEDGYLEDPPAEFKMNLILHAVTDWHDNRQHVNRLVGLATAAAVLLALQAGSLAAWVLLP
jgi:hypothetical protein